MTKLQKWRALLAVPVLAAAGSVQAATLEISITNTAQTGGFALTPFFTAFHDGSFDAFDVGGGASASVEALAEVGDASGLVADLAAQNPTAQSTVIAAPQSGPPTIDPGETSTVQIDLDPGSQRFFSFLSMLVPSNDTFLANDDPLAYELFDLAGAFVGDFSIDLSAAALYDAGTEVNDPTGGPAFVVGQDGTAGVAENGVIHTAESLTGFAGIATPLGLLDGGLIDFTGDPGAFSIARIDIRAVAPVPLPAAAFLMLGALGAMGAIRRKRPVAV